ncbi:polysaccharide pyruvyl transferase family protein [Acinetobacter indicus]|uniref:polysaccharide pyruvyl transferase family protein n=1 Tax=Acinetobacter indicus TaxID=756892 RepID=UPI0013154E98|nr:polysaccharide pyruvyl transferase family protein [Acinetobacter indicus]
MKKVGILTLGLKDNYGGILQTVALYTFLENNNFSPVWIKKYPIQKVWKKLATKILQMIPGQNYKNIRLSNIKYQNNLKFLSDHLPRQSDVFYFKSDIENYIVKENIDYLIVGSDQVWRYTYINDSEYDIYFLNFNIPYPINKIAYAASFGLSYWEEPSKKNEVSKYLNDFKAVSVREETGIEICNKDFNFNDAKLVLDPTLLIDPSIYVKFIKSDLKNLGGCVTYILDNNDRKKQVVSAICEKYNLPNNINLKSDTVLYPIEHWVTHIAKSDFVVTDSFHGMVFSIIFKKQFLVVVNKNRGSDRFYSICNQLGLTDRLVEETDNYSKELMDIDYDAVYLKLEKLKSISFDFLLNALRS